MQDPIYQELALTLLDTEERYRKNTVKSDAVRLSWVGRYYQRGLHQLRGCMAERKLKRPFLGYCGFVANHSYVEISGRDQQESQADTEIKDRGEAWKVSSA